MVETPNKVTRELATESFDYGNHTIEVSVSIEYHDVTSSHESKILTGYLGASYWRVVNVVAVKDGDEEFSYKTLVDLQKEDKPSRKIELPLLGEVVIKQAVKTKTLPEQVEKTVKPLLEDIDTFYEVTHANYDLDVEIAMERVENSMSWVDVEEKTDEISRELGLQPTD